MEHWEKWEPWWRMVESGVDALQISSCVFTPSIPWASEVQNSLKALSQIRLNFEDEAYVILYLLCTCGVLLFALLGALLAVFDCPCEAIIEVLWFTVGEAVLFGILFVPLMTNVFEIFHCNDSGFLFKAPATVECWGSEHVVYVTMGVVAIMLVLVCAVVKAAVQDRKSHNPKKKASYRPDVRYVDSKYLTYRLVIVAFSIALTTSNNSAQVTIGAMLILLGLLPFLFFLVKLPHNWMLLNYVKCGFYLATWWAFVALLAASIKDDASSGASGDMLGAYPAMALWGAAMCWFRARRFASQQADAGADWSSLSSEGQCKLSVTPHQSPLRISALVVRAVSPPPSPAPSPAGHRQQYQGMEMEEGRGPLVPAVELEAHVAAGDGGMAALLEALATGTAHNSGFPPVAVLRVLKDREAAAHEHVSSRAWGQLAQVLSDGGTTTEHLVALTVSGHRIRTADAQVLASALERTLQQRPRLAEIDLFQNGMDDGAVLALGTALHGLPGLKVLNLGSNAIGADTRTALESMAETRGGDLEMVTF